MVTLEFLSITSFVDRVSLEQGGGGEVLLKFFFYGYVNKKTRGNQAEQIAQEVKINKKVSRLKLINLCLSLLLQPENL